MSQLLLMGLGVGFASAAPSNPVYWFNLRGTVGGPAGFVGDGPTSTYSIGGIYPENTIGPLTGGWVAATGGGILNDQSLFGAFEHQAGRAPFNAGTDNRTFRVSGVSASTTYNIYLSQGVQGVGTASQMAIYSDNRVTLLATTTNAPSIPNGSYADAQGTVFGSAALWVAGQQPISVAATTSNFYFARGATSTGQINAIGIQAI